MRAPNLFLVDSTASLKWPLKPVDSNAGSCLLKQQSQPVFWWIQLQSNAGSQPVSVESTAVETMWAHNLFLVDSTAVETMQAHNLFSVESTAVETTTDSPA